MTAVFKKELHTYAVSMIGAAALAVLLLLTGFVTRYINCYNGYGSYAYTLQNLAFWFYTIAMPLLTMRTFSEEYRQKTDLLLLTAPVRTRSIVYGKYAALLVMLLIPAAFMKIYASVLGKYGAMPEAADNTALFLFLLMGAAYFAVGMLISSVTENQIISAVLCVLFVLVTQLISNVRAVISAGRGSALIFVLVLVCAAALLLYIVTKRLYLSAVVGISLLIAVILVFLLHGSWFDGRISSVIGILDFRSAFFTGVMGTLDLRAVLYFLSVTAAGTELTVYSVSRRSRPASGAEALLVPVMLLNLLLLNLIAGKLPSTLTVRDMTAQKLYTVTEATEEAARALEEDVTFYFLTAYGEEDRDLTALLDTYEGLSDRISVKKVDLAASPRFTEAYGEASLPYNSVIAESRQKFKIIRYEAFYPSDGDNAYVSSFDGEGQLTSALEYVTDPRQVTLYCTKGHGEPAFDTAMTDTVLKMNILTKEINLLAQDIPENCSALAVFAPSSDFSEEEAAKIRGYLEAGGSVLYVGLFSPEGRPVLDGLLASYGIRTVPGYVMERSEGMYVQLPYILLPVIAESKGITEGFPQENVLCPFAQGLRIDEAENVSAVPLLFSSDRSYAAADLSDDGNGSPEGAEEGPFALALTAKTGGSGSGKEGTLVCFTTPCIFSRSVLSQFLRTDMPLPSGNAQLFARSIAYVTETDAQKAIPAKSMTPPQLLLPQGVSVRFGIISMAVIPLLVLSVGMIIWLRRRKR